MNPTFDNRFTRELPADPEEANFLRQVMGACYSRVTPTAMPAPKLASFSQDVLDLLGLDVDPHSCSDFAEVFGGNRLLDGMDPFAMCYGGHQFGNWAGQLGDGRAINLGELVNPQGEHWTLQLKGSGLTPYSRSADGLAVLRSSVREFLCSEAMYHLGVPTTRALSLVVTGQEVRRDMFYDGHPKMEPGAIVCRVAPSFLRFGNYQIFAARNDPANLQRLLDFTLRNDFSELGEPSPATYLRWFDEVCQRTADMIVHWTRVGFVHGVMNTDNMSILGLTIDYGPYGWLEDYDPGWTPNTTDAQGRRYCFGQQPQMALWNLAQLANALLLVVDDKEALEASLQSYTSSFQDGWKTMMANKLGLVSFEEATDGPLVHDLLDLLQQVETDMTIFFRLLADLPSESSQSDSSASLIEPLLESYYLESQLSDEHQQATIDWLRRYQQRLKHDDRSDDDRRAAMNAVNPKYVLRNYLAQLAIDKAEDGDYSLVDELLELVKIIALRAWCYSQVGSVSICGDQQESVDFIGFDE